MKRHLASVGVMVLVSIGVWNLGGCSDRTDVGSLSPPMPDTEEEAWQIITERVRSNCDHFLPNERVRDDAERILERLVEATISESNVDLATETAIYEFTALASSLPASEQEGFDHYDTCAGAQIASQVSRWRLEGLTQEVSVEQTTTTIEWCGGIYPCEYTSEVEENYVKGCKLAIDMVSDLNRMVCECTYDEIRRNVAFEDFARLDSALRENPSVLEQAGLDEMKTLDEIGRYVRACIRKLS